MKQFRSLVRIALALAALLARVDTPAQTGPPPATVPETCATIHAIEVRGNRRMNADAVRFDLNIKPGDAWDEGKVRREFRRFWARGYFADLRFFRRCEPEGAVLVIELSERPTILSVTYEKTKAVNQQQIEDYFRERSFTLTIGSPLDRKRLWRAQSLIEELLGQKGYLEATVEAQVREISATARSVHFSIRIGGKTRIRDIAFTGNDRYSDRTLRKQLKLTKQWKWWWPFSRKSLYHPLKYQQDINNVLKYYRDRGYLDADVRPPVVEIEGDEEQADAEALEEAEKRRERELEKRAKKAEKKGEPFDVELAREEVPLEIKKKSWVSVTSGVVEGPLYRLGDVRFEGNQLFPDEQLRLLIPLRPGSVLADSVIEFGLEAIRRVYGQRGYVYAAVSRRFERREGEPVADVVVDIDEDQAYTVRRIEFSGNTQTQDIVLRRELNIAEGALLNREQLDRSMLKLRQLGFWLPNDEPALDPLPDQAEVDVEIAGQEQSRNEVQVGGGYSELEGGFFQASYQTSNFLGRGESLGVQAAVGGRFNQASIRFLERWFLDRPVTFGFTIFSRSSDFGRARDELGNLSRLTQRSRGGSVTLGKRLGDFTLLQLTYGYQQTRSESLSPFVTTGVPAADAVRFSFNTFETRLGTLTPLFSYRALDNPLRPTRGHEITIIPQIGAEFLGGDFDFIRPRIEGSIFRRLFGRFFFGLHGEFSLVKAIGDIQREQGFFDGIPNFQRFFIGGDTLGPRVFETRSIFPTRRVAVVDPAGNAIVDPATGLPIVTLTPAGGSKYGLIQFELGYPIGRTATLAGFIDAGGVYDNGVDINFSDARVSAGMEFRVFLPVFQAPIRLIYGWPVREFTGDRTSRFQFSIGLPF
ncbi:MAG: BamA/TamA family outer membrane protein [Acidobacteriota bacterium]|nr:MAG: BamA/TamA family outer membrane protein [Acidobacteriota bacterium]